MPISTSAPSLVNEGIDGFPRLSDACSFFRYDNGDGPEEYVLCVGGRQFKISALARRILERLDGKTSLREVAASLSTGTASISEAQLRLLLEQRYSKLGVIEGAGPSFCPSENRQRPGFPFLLSWDLIPQPLVDRAAAAFSFFFARPFVVISAILIVMSHLAVYSAPQQSVAFTSISYLSIIGLCIVSILVHELGHAAAVSRFGGTPGRIGFGLFLLMPTFYADVSQIWRFSRRRRMVVDLGGVYFQQICFVACTVAGFVSGRVEFLQVCRIIDLMVLMTLNPIFRFDGYWFLVDYLAMPKLHRVALRYPAHLIRRLAGRTPEPLALPPMGWLAGAIFRCYALLASLFLVAIFWIAFRSLNATLTLFPAVLPETFQAVVVALEQKDVLLFVSRILALFLLIAFPATALLGMFLYLRWIARWCAVKLREVLFRSTDGRDAS